jgi:hypothetical protein
MASYTASQLYGSGSLGENLTGLKTFTFNSADYSSYFTLETVRNVQGFYDTGSAPSTSGSWVVSSSMVPGFITSSYIASLVIPQGISVCTFTPAFVVTGSKYYLRGAGNFNLTIS